MNWLKRTKLAKPFIPDSNLGKLSIHEQITLFTSVHDFLINGFNLNEAFKFCSLVHPKLLKSIQQINQQLSQGRSFAESIKNLVNFRLYFQIKIAEVHGNLIKALGSVSRFLRMKQRQKSKLLSLMMYPIFLLILLIGIIIAIRLLVTPQIQGLNNGQHYFRYKLWLFIGVVPLVIAGYALIKYYFEQSPVWRINVLIKFPLIGPIYQSYYSYYVAGNLALMMSCGMDLQQIVNFLRAFRSNLLIKNLSWDVQKLIDHGGGLNQLMSKYHFLSRELMMLINAGDTTDVLAQKLRAYSKLEFKRMAKRSSRVISLLQPAMFLLIGLIIMGTYLSMLLPMYSTIKGVY